ncbi:MULTISPECIES: NADPH-dependent F420 reductase [Streptomyces]|uniref:NADPH-dependent F420 reductase n=1 Tax=Streptomyces sviceus (strain ATCC 29083 / DSM 924 / JCM 4929 / NBRC 13980 / NCIMB 11184 / NRRL 5439 / UC 5370) TaxID=463191 RepID=B5HUQ9_STRX2|nr:MULTISPECIES: NADPH-dependent F420 reductase [Streptomyces]EDY56564.1 NADPH-dependent F420 reductase [Streptomyces sviceus ATCC 29083]MYT10711.1 NAD(P)-binding domain-containing protein [Streptomyces sp. SID5470]
MKITIVGAGNMARGIATRALAGGHTVTITAKDPGKAVRLVDELRGHATGEGRIAAADASAVDTADIVVLAVPFDAAKQLAAAYGERLSGKVLVDISNPVDASLDALVVAPGTSAAEEITEAVAPGTRVVKAFNTTFATTLIAGEVNGTVLDVFIAGDDEAARKQVADLVTSGGLNPVDVGALRHARELEGFQLLHMALQIREAGHGWASTIKIVAPEP